MLKHQALLLMHPDVPDRDRDPASDPGTPSKGPLNDLPSFQDECRKSVT
jgi:hypothetical protein